MVPKTAKDLALRARGAAIQVPARQYFDQLDDSKVREARR